MLDTQPLLEPIPGESPTGQSLRFDPLYDEIRRLRQEDDASLPQGIWTRELKRADWPGVAAACIEALQSRTKDLQLAAWLTEAWIRLHGYRGLAEGLRVMAALCRDYWDTLYPSLDPDGTDAGGRTDARLAPVIWTVEKLTVAVKNIKVTQPTAEDSSAYGWSDWEIALHLVKVAKGDAAAAAAAAEKRGDITQPKFLVSVSLTPAPWFVSLGGEVNDALAALAELDTVLTERCGEKDAPSVRSMREALSAVQGFISRVVQERVEKGELMVEAAAGPAKLPIASSSPSDTDLAPAAAPAVAQSGPRSVNSRNEAYQALRDASEYLLRTEPHSPVPYLVRRAISWGNLSLAELLEELLQKNNDVSTIYALLGMKKEAGMK
jgi:type VI secretion system ImpA family protein